MPTGGFATSTANTLWNSQKSGNGSGKRSEKNNKRRRIDWLAHLPGPIYDEMMLVLHNERDKLIKRAAIYMPPTQIRVLQACRDLFRKFSGLKSTRNDNNTHSVTIQKQAMLNTHACSSECDLFEVESVYICKTSGNYHICTEELCDSRVESLDCETCLITCKVYERDWETNPFDRWNSGDQFRFDRNSTFDTPMADAGENEWHDDADEDDNSGYRECSYYHEGDTDIHVSSAAANERSDGDEEMSDAEDSAKSPSSNIITEDETSASNSVRVSALPTLYSSMKDRENESRRSYCRPSLADTRMPIHDLKHADTSSSTTTSIRTDPMPAFLVHQLPTGSKGTATGSISRARQQDVLIHVAKSRKRAIVKKLSLHEKDSVAEQTPRDSTLAMEAVPTSSSTLTVTVPTSIDSHHLSAVPHQPMTVRPMPKKQTHKRQIVRKKANRVQDSDNVLAQMTGFASTAAKYGFMNMLDKRKFTGTTFEQCLAVCKWRDCIARIAHLLWMQVTQTASFKAHPLRYRMSQHFWAVVHHSRENGFKVHREAVAPAADARTALKSEFYIIPSISLSPKITPSLQYQPELAGLAQKDLRNGIKQFRSFVEEFDRATLQRLADQTAKFARISEAALEATLASSSSSSSKAGGKSIE